MVLSHYSNHTDNYFQAKSPSMKLDSRKNKNKITHVQGTGMNVSMLSKCWWWQFVLQHEELCLLWEVGFSSLQVGFNTQVANQNDGELK